jgi:hypothetical protein
MLSVFPNLWELDGLDMQTVTRTLFAAVLVCSLLPLTAGSRHPRHGHHRGHARHALTVRLRRSGTNHPAHHPVRPALAVMLPPDEDDDADRLRLTRTDAFAYAQTEEMSVRPSSGPPAAWPAVPDRPLYQTLGILLI